MTLKPLDWKNRNRRAVVGGASIVALLLFSAIAYVAPRWFTKETREESSAVDQGLAEFMSSHWQRPIPFQGPAPSAYSTLEASLRPEACGSCHQQQYQDWKASLHSRAMGPGPWGQIVDMIGSSPDEAIFCMTCHAPLSEQLPVVVKTSADGRTTYAPNAGLDDELQARGITCAACHVRRHERFGPPKRQNGDGLVYPADLPKHGGVKRTAHFERAEFCKDCHQFDPDNTLLINGKPLQDTYREWQNSMWARDGVSCQACHMSNRRHLWKGIHDKEWVQGGIRTKVERLAPEGASAKSAGVRVEVINAAVGHKFPTYITPKVFVRASLLDSADQSLPATQQERVIGWDARFVDGEWKEFFDTRIEPGKSFSERFRWTLPRGAAKIRVWVEVHPDHFYHVHFYPAHLQRSDLSAQGRKLIEQALAESGKSPYVLFEEILAVKTP